MKPVLQALVVAERVYTLNDGRKIIAGTMNGMEITKSKAPPSDDTGTRKVVAGGNPGAPWVYISLTDICAKTTLDLQFVNLSKNAVLFQQRIEFQESNRLNTTEIVAPLPPLEMAIAETGQYALEIVCEGEILGSHRISAKVTHVE